MYINKIVDGKILEKEGWHQMAENQAQDEERANICKLLIWASQNITP